jgi:LemA protein
MGIGMWIALGLLVLAALYVVGIYNRLVSLKHAVDKAWSNNDELPKLVEVCQQYKQFEQQTLQQVIAARSQVQAARQAEDVPALGRAETALRSGLGQIFAVAEAYPELRSNDNFMQLQSRISQLENAIADRREFYNEAVNLNNVGIEQFPSNLVASRFAFAAKPLLQFSEAEKQDVNLKALFS